MNCKVAETKGCWYDRADILGQTDGTRQYKSQCSNGVYTRLTHGHIEALLAGEVLGFADSEYDHFIFLDGEFAPIEPVPGSVVQSSKEAANAD